MPKDTTKQLVSKINTRVRILESRIKKADERKASLDALISKLTKQAEGLRGALAGLDDAPPAAPAAPAAPAVPRPPIYDSSGFDPTKPYWPRQQSYYTPEYLARLRPLDVDDSYFVGGFYHYPVPPPRETWVQDPNNVKRNVRVLEWQDEYEEAVALLARKEAEYDERQAERAAEQVRARYAAPRSQASARADESVPAADVPEGNGDVPPEVLALSHGRDIA